MNQLYRALHMPPLRLVRKLMGHKEIYTIGWRRFVPGESLPETGAGEFTPMPYSPDYWYADPMLFEENGEHWLFCEAYDRRTHKGLLAVSRITDEGPETPVPILEKEFHLSFPNVFRWRGEIWMLPETGNDHSLCLYKCVSFPYQWQQAARFSLGEEVCDAIVNRADDEALEIQASVTLPADQLQVQYRRYTLSGTEGHFALAPHEEFNRAQLWNYTDRSAGPITEIGQNRWRCAQLSTDVDYGVSIQFWKLTDHAETPDKLVTVRDVSLAGIARSRYIGTHTYGHDSRYEIIDMRYLK